MRSPKQIDASRANGAKSRGPVTDAGKATSAANGALSPGPSTPEAKARVAHNAIRHGLLAESIVLDQESAAQFDALLAHLHEELQPAPGIETRLVEVMAIADWRRSRIWCIEKEQIAAETRKRIDAGCNGTGVDPSGCTAAAFRELADHSRSLDLLMRYETRYDRQYMRTLARFEARRRKYKKTKISKQPEPKPT